MQLLFNNSQSVSGQMQIPKTLEHTRCYNLHNERNFTSFLFSGVIRRGKDTCRKSPEYWKQNRYQQRNEKIMQVNGRFKGLEVAGKGRQIQGTGSR